MDPRNRLAVALAGLAVDADALELPCTAECIRAARAVMSHEVGDDISEMLAEVNEALAEAPDDD